MSLKLLARRRLPKLVQLSQSTQDILRMDNILHHRRNPGMMTPCKYQRTLWFPTMVSFRGFHDFVHPQYIGLGHIPPRRCGSPTLCLLILLLVLKESQQAHQGHFGGSPKRDVTNFLIARKTSRKTCQVRFVVALLSIFTLMQLTKEDKGGNQ